jgi:PAS domain S-box-containing protein
MENTGNEQSASFDATRATLAAIVEWSNDGIIGKTTDGIITHWNRGAERIYGYCAEEAIGKPATMLVPPSRHAEVHELLDKIRQGETVVSLESEGIRKDGTRIQVALTLSPIKDAAGAIIGISTITRDITEKKRMEEALRQANVYTRSLIEVSLDPLVTISPEGKITDVNSATENVTGRNRAELIGTDFSDYFSEPEMAREGYQRVFRQGYVTDYPLAIRHRDGHLTDVLYNASVYRDQGGEVLGVFAAARDITERKRAEAALRHLNRELRAISNCNQALMRAEDEQSLLGEICRIICDEAGYRMAWVGYAEQDEARTVRPMAWAGVEDDYLATASITWADTERGRGPTGTAIRSGESVCIQDFMADQIAIPWRESAEQRGYRSSIALPIKDANAHTFGALNIYSTEPDAFTPDEKRLLEELAADMSFGIAVLRARIERQRAEEEIRRLNQELEQRVNERTADLVLARDAAEAANQAKSVFLANMSHELRTPLNAILGFSEMLRKDPLLPEEQRQNVDIINHSGAHLLALINDVLEMAKIEAGRVQLTNAPFDLGGMVRDVTDMMQIRAEEKGLLLRIDQSSRFPRYIVGDEARLRQVLTNLIGNAVKFTLHGEVTLRLDVRQNKIAHLLIEVGDTGPGIAPEAQQTIFEPFVQLGEHGSKMGTGLGLTITRQFVQLMGGSITLESTPGQGSLFRVDLPLQEVQEADFAKAQHLAKGDVESLAPGQAEQRILIVEDQHDNQLLLTELMRSVGLETRVADNGKQAVELFQSWHPHLIWMDRRMPVMDGAEATRRIRELPGGKEVKIVAVTASAFNEQRSEMLAIGMDDVVRKPYHSSEIYACLSKQLGLEFTYKVAADEMEAPAAPTLTAEMLSTLPEALRTELQEALESLDRKRIELVVQRVASCDTALHKSLKHLVDNFEYPVIMEALRTD